jgi:polyphosphate kinase
MLKGKQNKHAVVEAPDASGKISRKQFKAELAKLLTRLQTWVKDRGARVIVVFEGRDTAGKGGVISRITARTSPRVFRHVALPTPSDRQKSQVYIQRYIAQFPAAGEIILFDRSWYNRAGVERVMSFCTDEQYERFMKMVPVVEQELIVGNGIILRKYFLDVSQEEQRRRFEARINDPMKHLEAEPNGHRVGAALVGLHGGLPAHERGHTHTMGALAHRAGGRQAPRPAEPDPASARQHPL